MRGRTEVAVIGGGMAGLMAARRLTDQGVAVELLEAKPHVGGRVMTMHPDAALPAELGPEFVHGEPEVTLALLREIRAEREPVIDTHHFRTGGRLVEQRDFWERFGRLLEQAPPASHDESARAYMHRVHMTGDDARLFATFVEGFYAADLDTIGVASIAGDMSEGSGQMRVRGGYGQLAEWLLARILRKHGSVHGGHVVTAIDWSSDIQIAYRKTGGELGMMAADRVIVALPLAGMKHGAVAFRPALPTDFLRALHDLEMGPVVKIVACLTRRTWPADMSFVHTAAGRFPTFWFRSNGDAHQLVAWAGGHHAQLLSRRNPTQLLTLAITELASAIDASATTIADAIDHWHFHDYAADPFARGAYSYTKVGGLGAADVLSQPLGDRLFFAGEATDADYEGTVAGALASGERAARQVLARISASRAA